MIKQPAINPMLNLEINPIMLRLSVSDCFSAFVWQGKSTVSLAPASTVRKASWQTTCLQEFFAQYNWSGRSSQQADSLSPSTVRSFSVTMPVHQFFDCFVWAGPSEIAQLQTSHPQTTQFQIAPQSNHVTRSEQGHDRDFKLSNFSNLF
jgi:hypothetical protein